LAPRSLGIAQLCASVSPSTSKKEYRDSRLFSERSIPKSLALLTMPDDRYLYQYCGLGRFLDLTVTGVGMSWIQLEDLPETLAHCIVRYHYILGVEKNDCKLEVEC
jgi:hypothetical protein